MAKLRLSTGFLVENAAFSTESRVLNLHLLDKKSSTWIRQKTKFNDIITLYRKRKLNHARKMLQRQFEERWDVHLLKWITKTQRPLG
jgi:hypothetical protein